MRRLRGGGVAARGAGRGRADRGRIPRPARGDNVGRGARARRAAAPRRASGQSVLRLGRWRRSRHRGGVSFRGARRQARPGQPAHGRQPDGAARLLGDLRRGRAEVRALRLHPGHGRHAVSARAHDGDSRRQDRRRRRGRRRRLRSALQHVPGIRCGAPRCEEDQARGEVDRQPSRGFPFRRAGPGRCQHQRIGARCLGEVPRAALCLRRRPRRLSRADRALHQHAGRGRLPDRRIRRSRGRARACGSR